MSDSKVAGARPSDQQQPDPVAEYLDSEDGRALSRWQRGLLWDVAGLIELYSDGRPLGREQTAELAALVQRCEPVESTMP